MSQVDLRLALWNSNGISRHVHEVEMFLRLNKIDIMLLSETHGTDKTHIYIKGYSVVYANHPGNKAFGGAAIIIKSALNYTLCNAHQSDEIQAAIIELLITGQKIIIASVYCRPRFNLKEADYSNLFSLFGSKFIIGGDFNAKNTIWGSRLTTAKGKELQKCLNCNNIEYISGGEPTYWPSDPCKIPDLLDLFFQKGLNPNIFTIENLPELSSDHTPIILTCCALKNQNVTPNLINYKKLKKSLETNININVSLKSSDEINKAICDFENLIKSEVGKCKKQIISIASSNKISLEIRNMIQEKRKLRSRWQITRDPHIKTLLNRATKMLKNELKIAKETQISNRIQNLTPYKDTDYSLWEEISHIKRPVQRQEPIQMASGVWLKNDKQKVEAFKTHYENQFTSYNDNDNIAHLDSIKNFINSPMPVEKPLKKISPSEIRKHIKALNHRKASGPDQISGKIVKILPPKGIIWLTYVFNAILRLGYFPDRWKMARVIAIAKPGKSPNKIESYRPISVLSVFSKLIERIILHRMLKYLEGKIPEHQFGFREGHGTPEQCHRIVNFIRNSMENKEYCTAVFLDVSKAFDKVWHLGLLYKIKQILPLNIYVILKSYLTNRQFYVVIRKENSSIGAILAGVPQGSVIGPYLYTIFTRDLPEIYNGLTATYADDTAYMYSHISPEIANECMQNHLYKVEEWTRKWNIRINTDKSQNVVFTLNRKASPSLNFNGLDVPKTDTAKYLGLTLDTRLTFKHHITQKRKEFNMKRKKLYYLINSKSKLSLKNKLLLYSSVLKPIWTYCIPLWSLASKSNIKKIQACQNITLRVMTGAHTYIPNEQLHRELKIKTVEEEASKQSEKHRIRLENHSNALANNLSSAGILISRLKKKVFQFNN